MKTHYIKLFAEQTLTENVFNYGGIVTQSIRIAGRAGKWSMISTICGKTNNMNGAVCIAIFGLFEHDTLGDATDYAVCYFDWYSGDNNWKEIDGTYDDLFTALRDFDVIE